MWFRWRVSSTAILLDRRRRELSADAEGPQHRRGSPTCRVDLRRPAVVRPVHRSQCPGLRRRGRPCRAGRDLRSGMVPPDRAHRVVELEPRRRTGRRGVVSGPSPVTSAVISPAGWPGSICGGNALCACLTARLGHLVRWPPGHSRARPGSDPDRTRTRLRSRNRASYGLAVPHADGDRAEQAEEPVPGTDVAGTVEAVGTEVKGLSPGTMCSVVLRRLRRVRVAHPRTTRDEAGQTHLRTGRAVGVSASTALQLLRDDGKVRPGQKVLSTGPRARSGTFAVQIAKAFGAEVTGVCSTKNLELVARLVPTMSSTTPRRISEGGPSATTSSSTTSGTTRCPTQAGTHAQRDVAVQWRGTRCRQARRTIRVFDGVPVRAPAGNRPSRPRTEPT